MKRAIPLTILGLLLVACSGASTMTPVTTEMLEISTLTATLSLTETPEPTHTPTPMPTLTPTPIPTFALSGVVFFDYNGNGIRDENEPPIPGAVVEMGRLAATTDSDGVYSLQGVRRGTQSVRVSADGFRYIALSLEAFQSSQQPVTARIEGDTQKDWGLMQGFLTLPFRPGTDFEVWSYFDLDPGPGIRRYDGRTDYEARVANNHPAIDYRVSVGTPVVAAAPGEVVFVGTDPNDSCPGNITVRVFHTIGSQLFETAYNHLSGYEVNVGDQVSRGQLIAYSGESGECSTGRPHLEMDFQSVPWGGIGQHLDPGLWRK